MHLLAYALSLGVFSTVMILLSELVVFYFKVFKCQDVNAIMTWCVLLQGAMEAPGWMGFCMMSSGLLGSVIFGVCLDKTHQYK